MRFRMAASGILALALALAPAEARADPPGQTEPAGSPPAEAPRKPAHRSPALALGLSLGVTGLGVAGAVAAASQHNAPGEFLLAGVAVYLGPSIGRWYGGGSAAVGLLGRAAGGAFLIAAASERPIDPNCDPGNEDCTGQNEAIAKQERRERTLLVTGAVLWIGASVYDFVMAPLDAREFNREHAVTVTPTVMRGSGQGAALVPGLALSGSL